MLIHGHQKTPMFVLSKRFGSSACMQLPQRKHTLCAASKSRTQTTAKYVPQRCERLRNTWRVNEAYLKT
jgi:hypothetical protein